MRGIRQLAKHLDISIGTVSRALNGKPDVNEETRKRVLAAAEELGYVANQSGRSLRQGTTNVIGLMIESSKETVENSDNFFLGLTGGLQSVLARHKLDLVMLPCPSDEDPHEYRKAHGGAPRGRCHDHLRHAAHRQAHRFPGEGEDPVRGARAQLVGGNYTWIDLDFEGVAACAVDRLVAKGHRRIAIAAPSNDVNLGYIFVDAYRRSLERHGIEYDPALVIRVKSSEQGGYQAGTNWFA
jgi:DNA-binding LacI/PurR family transcriptional regulator